MIDTKRIRETLYDSEKFPDDALPRLFNAFVDLLDEIDSGQPMDELALAAKWARDANALLERES